MSLVGEANVVPAFLSGLSVCRGTVGADDAVLQSVWRQAVLHHGPEVIPAPDAPRPAPQGLSSLSHSLCPPSVRQALYHFVSRVSTSLCIRAMHARLKPCSKVPLSTHVSCRSLVHQRAGGSGASRRGVRGGGRLRVSGGHQSAPEAPVRVPAEPRAGPPPRTRHRGEAEGHQRPQGPLSPRPQVR